MYNKPKIKPLDYSNKLEMVQQDLHSAQEFSEKAATKHKDKIDAMTKEKDRIVKDHEMKVDQLGADIESMKMDLEKARDEVAIKVIFTVKSIVDLEIEEW